MTTSRWTELSIQNFRGLSELRLEGFGTFNVLLGANDVGKTSVLEAIFLLTGLGNLQLPIRIQNFRNFIVPDIEGFGFLLHGLDSDSHATLAAHSADGSRRTLELSTPRDASIGDPDPHPSGDRRLSQSAFSTPMGRRALGYTASVKPTTSDDPIEFSGTLTMNSDGLEQKIDPGHASEHILPSRYLTPNASYDAKLISDVAVHKKTAELVEYLQTINPAVTDLTSDGNLAYADIGLPTMLPLNMLGTGMSRATAMIAPCLLDDSRILMIDEVENGLHYRAIPSLLEILLRISYERNIQMFITTHSRTVLEDLYAVLQREECELYREKSSSYALQREQNDIVGVYRYGYSDLEYALKHDIEIR
ncbi:AAA family ATPase [Candidatus Palauibacter sp.]|uniref:AAA family ATPase n=1 Tax=Candidatus Palauibacter sp. TaxID=3101350 RepID=UPI003B5251B1